MLGAEQRAWLVDAVSDPAPRWVLLASGTVLSELTIDAPDSLDGVLPEKYAVVDGRATNTDQWDGYLAEREQLAAALGQRAGGNLRSEEHTSELQSLMRHSYAVFCLKQ